MSSKKSKAGLVGGHKRLLEAVSVYVETNSGFESTAAVKLVTNDIKACDSAMDLALVPLKRMVFSYDVALKWGVFLMIVVPQLTGGEPSKFVKTFDVKKYLESVIAIYDLAVDSDVRDHLAESSDDEDE